MLTLRSAHHRFRSLRDVVHLAMSPNEPCYTANLAALSREQVEAWLRSPAVNAAWREASSRIASAIEIGDGQTEGVNPGDRRALFHLVAGARARSVLEIGTNVGASTINIAAALLHNGKESANLTTVDICDANDPVTGYWKARGLARSPRDAMALIGAGDVVRFVTGDSASFLRAGQDAFDLIFLDGDHGARTVFLEVPLALQRLNSGGMIVLHDFFPGNRPLWRGQHAIAGPWLAIERLRNNGARLQAIPLGALPWPTKAGSNVTSLAVLAKA